jgi:hypothetical protein
MVGAYNTMDTPRTEQVTDALDTFNMFLKSLQIEDFLWLKQFATLFLNKGQTSYKLAPSTYTGFNHCATAYVQTNLAANAAIGAATVTLDSATGITNGDFIGISNDNDIIEWFYVSILGVVASIFTDAALTIPGALGVAATADNVVYSHTVASQIKRPTRVFAASRKSYDVVAADGNEIPIDVVSRSDYMSMPNKTTSNKVLNVYYDPQLVCGIIYVWPTTNDSGDKLILTIDRPIQDVVAAGETVDIPQEVIRFLTWGLAIDLEPEYPIEIGKLDRYKNEFNQLKGMVKSYNREPVSTFFATDN